MNHSSQDSETTLHEDSPEVNASSSATTTSGDAQIPQAQSTGPQKSTSVKEAVTPGSPGKRTTPAPPPPRTSSRTNRGVPPPCYGVDVTNLHFATFESWKLQNI